MSVLKVANIAAVIVMRVPAPNTAAVATGAANVTIKLYQQQTIITLHSKKYYSYYVKFRMVT